MNDAFLTQLIVLMLVLLVSTASGSDRRYMLLKKPIQPASGGGAAFFYAGEVTIDDQNRKLVLRIDMKTDPLIIELSYHPESMVIELTNRSSVRHRLDIVDTEYTSLLSDAIFHAAGRPSGWVVNGERTFAFSLHDIITKSPGVMINQRKNIHIDGVMVTFGKNKKACLKTSSYSRAGYLLSPGGNTNMRKKIKISGLSEFAFYNILEASVIALIMPYLLNRIPEPPLPYCRDDNFQSHGYGGGYGDDGSFLAY